MTKSILLPIDLDQQSSWEHCLPVAIKMARSENAELHVLSVIPDYGMSVVSSFFPPDHAKNAMAEARKLIREFVAENISDDLNVKTHIHFGSIYKEILKAADEIDCGLIIMASHRPESKDYLLGPNAARVVRHAKQSIYVVRA
ncbi:MAG: universal stress protein [Hyphomicrobiales bacterium]|nr:universal stress protein [Hyphomicrobiales bacterium]